MVVKTPTEFILALIPDLLPEEIEAIKAKLTRHLPNACVDGKSHNYHAVETRTPGFFRVYSVYYALCSKCGHSKPI